MDESCDCGCRGRRSRGLVLVPPERLFTNVRVDEGMPTVQSNASTQPIESGTFYTILHPTSGTATIYRMGDGSHVLRFTNFDTSNGPDVHVYMVAADDAKDVATVEHAGFVDLGSIKGNVGDQNYTLPSESGSREVSRGLDLVQAIQRELRSCGVEAGGDLSGSVRLGSCAFRSDPRRPGAPVAGAEKRDARFHRLLHCVDHMRRILSRHDLRRLFCEGSIETAAPGETDLGVDMHHGHAGSDRLLEVAVVGSRRAVQSHEDMRRGFDFANPIDVQVLTSFTCGDGLAHPVAISRRQARACRRVSPIQSVELQQAW